MLLLYYWQRAAMRLNWLRSIQDMLALFVLVKSVQQHCREAGEMGSLSKHLTT